MKNDRVIFQWGSISKASNTYTFVCKKHYVDILIEEFGLHSLPGNPTYNLKDFSASEVLDNHKSVLTSFGIQTSNEELDLPYIYWIPKMHKILINIDSLRVHRRVRPNLHPFYSQNCLHMLTRSPEVLRDSLLKEWDQSDVDPQELDHLKSSNFSLITNITSFDCSTLYTIIMNPHQKLKSRLATITRNSFIHKNGNRRHKYSVLGCEGPYFVKEHSDSKSKYTRGC